VRPASSSRRNVIAPQGACNFQRFSDTIQHKPTISDTALPIIASSVQLKFKDFDEAIDNTQKAPKVYSDEFEIAAYSWCVTSILCLCCCAVLLERCHRRTQPALEPRLASFQRPDALLEPQATVFIL
jgi:hypothetical protein